MLFIPLELKNFRIAVVFGCEFLIEPGKGIVPAKNFINVITDFLRDVTYLDHRISFFLSGVAIGENISLY
jgi:hypothetical protein